MSRGERVSFVGLAGELRPPGQIAAELRARSCTDVALLDGHLFGTIPTYARLVCHQLATVKRPWVVQADAAALDRGLLRLARRLNSLRMLDLRFAELVCQRLFMRKPIAEIDTPPPVNPSKPKPNFSPDQLEFIYV